MVAWSPGQLGYGFGVARTDKAAGPTMPLEWAPQPQASLCQTGPMRTWSTGSACMRSGGSVGVRLILCLALVTAVCSTAARPDSSSALDTPAGLASSPLDSLTSAHATFVEEACAVPRELLLRIWRGYRSDRGGDIQLLPLEPNYVGGGFSHSGPWDYLQEIPMFLYGPGFVKPGTYRRPVTLADVASTQGQLVKFPFETPDGGQMREALVPAADRDLPRLVVTLVWDSAGMDVLDVWPKAWPYLGSLLPDGAWFSRATVGASPSNTPTGHATLGTGGFPRRNGFIDEFVRLNGEIVKPNVNGPGLLILPTLADLFDPAMDNRPIVGAIVSLAAHAMMMSHGSLWNGGDRDIAVMREVEDASTGGLETVRWNLTRSMAPYYELPSYSNDVGSIEPFAQRLDRQDGRLDGLWRDNDIDGALGGFNTPARTPFQTRLIKEVIRREGFGADEVPDLLYLNYKAIDVVGHLVGAEGIEMSDAVRYQDDALQEVVGFLNREVGRGEWVMLITADHGTQRDPERTGGSPINTKTIEDALVARFDDHDNVPVLQHVRHTQIWLDRGELAANGHTLDEVATFLGNMTKAEIPGSQTLPASELDDRVFEAVFPSDVLDRLPCLPNARGSL